MNKNYKRKYYILTWLLTGALIATAAFYSYTNNFEKISFSIQDNDIYDVDGRVPGYGVQNGDVYSLNFAVYLEHDDINYLRIIADGIGQDVAKCVFRGVTDNYEPVVELTDVDLKDGCNDFKIQSGEFTIVELTVIGPEKNVIDGIQFRESIEEHNLTDALPFILLSLLIYSALSTAAYFLIKKTRSRRNLDIYKPSTQHLEAKIGRLGEAPSITSTVPDSKIVSYVRIFIFIILIINSLAIEMHDVYNTYFRLYICIQLGLVLLLIPLIAGSGYIKKDRNYDYSIVSFWAFFSVYTFASDILVDKKYRFSQIAIFVVFVILGFVCTYVNKQEKIICDFQRATQLFLLLLVILSLTLNHEFGSSRYSGPIKNPSIYALYLCSIAAVLIGTLEYQIRIKAHLRKKIITYTELLVVLVLMLLSQSITPFLALITIILCFIFRMIAFYKGKNTAIVVTIISAIAIVTITVFGLYTLQKAGYASDSAIIKKIESANITSILSKRDYYWREYLREMNLFGHGKKPYLWEKRILPHNAIIGMAYMYGVPCIIPYIIMMIMSIEKSFRLADTSLDYAPVPFYCIMSFVLMSIADNVEQPFVWMPWIACYLMIAFISVLPEKA